MPSSSETSGALGGAAQGAVTGATVGSFFGPVGTAVGAAVGGVVGAIGGFFGGSSSDAKRTAQKAQQQIEKTQGALQRRSIILEGYVARARAVAAAGAQDEGGGLQSSAPLGAVNSIGSQLEFNLRYFDTQARQLDKRNKFIRKAGKYDQYANTANSILSVGQSAVGLYGLFQTPPSSTSSTSLGKSPSANFNPNIYD
jgi:hypothetical protein